MKIPQLFPVVLKEANPVEATDYVPRRAAAGGMNFGDILASIQAGTNNEPATIVEGEQVIEAEAPKEGAESAEASTVDRKQNPDLPPSDGEAPRPKDESEHGTEAENAKPVEGVKTSPESGVRGPETSTALAWATASVPTAKPGGWTPRSEQTRQAGALSPNKASAPALNPKQAIVGSGVATDEAGRSETPQDLRPNARAAPNSALPSPSVSASGVQITTHLDTATPVTGRQADNSRMPSNPTSIEIPAGTHTNGMRTEVLTNPRRMPASVEKLPEPAGSPKLIPESEKSGSVLTANSSDPELQATRQTFPVSASSAEGPGAAKDQPLPQFSPSPNTANSPATTHPVEPQALPLRSADLSDETGKVIATGSRIEGAPGHRATTTDRATEGFRVARPEIDRAEPSGTVRTGHRDSGRDVLPDNQSVAPVSSNPQSLLGTASGFAMPSNRPAQQFGNVPRSGPETTFGHVDASELVAPLSRDGPLGLSATAPAREMSAPAQTAEIVRQIISALAKSDGGQTEVVLNPRELGKVQIHVSVTDTGASVTLSVERTETHEIMRRHIELLEKEFLAIGYSGVGLGDGGRNNFGERRGATAAEAAELPEDVLSQEATANGSEAGITTGLDIRM